MGELTLTTKQLQERFPKRKGESVSKWKTRMMSEVDKLLRSRTGTTAKGKRMSMPDILAQVFGEIQSKGRAAPWWVRALLWLIRQVVKAVGAEDVVIIPQPGQPQSISPHTPRSPLGKQRETPPKDRWTVIWPKFDEGPPDPVKWWKLFSEALTIDNMLRDNLNRWLP